MDVPDTQKMLQEVLRLERENNALIKKLIKFHRRAVILNVIYWIVIIGATVGLFAFLRPYLDSVISFYKASTDGVSGFWHSI